VVLRSRCGALDRSALTAFGGSSIGCDFGLINPAEKTMSDTTSQSRKLKLGTMTVIITLEGDAYHVRAHKATPLTDEDYIQQQILEHQLRYYGLQPRGTAGSE
jgi:hypothetical protein